MNTESAVGCREWRIEMSIDSRELEITELLRKVGKEHDRIRTLIELDYMQNESKRFEHILCYEGIRDWKAIEHMGEMEALEKRWEYLKILLGDFEGDILSWGYTNLDSVKKVIEITDHHVTNKSITDRFMVSLTFWIDKEEQLGEFRGIEWDGRG